MKLQRDRTPNLNFQNQSLNEDDFASTSGDRGCRSDRPLPKYSKEKVGRQKNEKAAKEQASGLKTSSQRPLASGAITTLAGATGTPAKYEYSDPIVKQRSVWRIIQAKPEIRRELLGISVNWSCQLHFP